MNDNIIIKTLPSLKEKMYTTGRVISISYGILIRSSDKELKFSIYHELGHHEQQHILFLIIMVYSLSVLLLNLLLIFIFKLVYLLPIVFFIYYLVCCWIARTGEYFADCYAFKISNDVKGMKLFLNNLNPEPGFLKYLYVFRWHPSRIKRLNNLMNHVKVSLCLL